uniref:Uncharacterized protein n=1 Tax=Anguilla anguilla TaxID=7936 RepID=A0A0E9QLM3_ANGAN
MHFPDSFLKQAHIQAKGRTEKITLSWSIDREALTHRAVVQGGSAK